MPWGGGWVGPQPVLRPSRLRNVTPRSVGYGGMLQVHINYGDSLQIFGLLCLPNSRVWALFLMYNYRARTQEVHPVIEPDLKSLRRNRKPQLQLGATGSIVLEPFNFLIYKSLYQNLFML